MLIEQPPRFFRQLYAKASWRMNPLEKAVYLTFDDGPIPEVTPWVLDLLDRYHIKATFFMVGDNVFKHPDIYKMVVERGHRIGNHTHNHIQGISFNRKVYLENIEKANNYLHTDLFRPPHGFFKKVQYRVIRNYYHIIMWDVVTRDYNPHLTGEKVFAIVKKYVRNGSIITFHDSLRSVNNMQWALPRSIEWLQQQGYTFKIFD